MHFYSTFLLFLQKLKITWWVLEKNIFLKSESKVCILKHPILERASLVAQTVKNTPAVWESYIQSRVGKIPWRGEWQPTPIFWPREFHEHRLQSVGLQRLRHDWTTNTFILGKEKVHLGGMYILNIRAAFSTCT